MTLFVVVLSSLALLVQAVPKSAVLDESYALVVELPSLKRDAGERKYMLKAFGQEIDLDLHRNDDLLPTNLPVHVYGEDEEGNPTIDDWTHRTDGFQGLYTDIKTGASLLIDEVDGQTKLTGSLGADLIIEPITNIDLDTDVELQTDDLAKRSYDEISQKRAVKETVSHIVYKVKREKEETTTSDYVEAEDQEEEKTTEKRAAPSRVYIPTYVVVDYALWKKLDRSEADVINYMKIFFNSVQMLYSSITSPYVTVSIHGMTICKSQSSCRMVEDHRLGSDGVNAKASLSAISKYAYSQKSITGEDYALMIVITDYDMCSPTSSGSCQRSTAGLAYVGTACDSYRYSKTSKTGLAEDHGAFDGIKTVAHEMGHILGMKHDGDGPASSGAPGALSCSWNDNYIMGHTQFVENQFRWSTCSVRQLQWYSVQSKASCLRVKPGTSRYSLINTLPGKKESLDNQCKMLYGSTSTIGCRLPGVNSGNDQLCLGLMCKTGGGRCSSKTPPAEGSYCGPQRYCRMGKCVCDPSAPLPTAPPMDPTCTSDNSRIRINNQACVPLLTASDGLKHCESALVKKYCCKSRAKYCKATPIKCDGSAPVTPKANNPVNHFTLAPTTTRGPTYKPPTGANCGKPCTDTPNMRINGKSCTSLLNTNSAKTQYCDNPTIIKHCCSTRARVCSGFHSITPSCDPSCQDNPGMKINGKKCVQFLATTRDRDNFCDQAITAAHCCATKRKVCR